MLLVTLDALEFVALDAFAATVLLEAPVPPGPAAPSPLPVLEVESVPGVHEAMAPTTRSAKGKASILIRMEGTLSLRARIWLAQRCVEIARKPSFSRTFHRPRRRKTCALRRVFPSTQRGVRTAKTDRLETDDREGDVGE